MALSTGSLDKDISLLISDGEEYCQRRLLHTIPPCPILGVGLLCNLMN